MLAKKGLLLVLKGQTIILRTWALKNQMPNKLFLWTSDIFSWPFWANVTNGESFVFYWHFCPSLPMVKNFCFIGIFVRLTTVKIFVFIGIFVQEDQRWKFCFLLAFVSKLTNGESFSFFWWKFWSVWQWLLLLGTLAMDTNVESYAIWSSLRSTRVRVRRRQSLAPRCANRSSHSR